MSSYSEKMKSAVTSSCPQKIRGKRIETVYTSSIYTISKEIKRTAKPEKEKVGQNQR